MDNTTQIQITYDLEDCTGCPLVYSKFIKKFGLDYFCTANSNREIMRKYISKDNQQSEVPVWCPHRIDNE